MNGSSGKDEKAVAEGEERLKPSAGNIFRTDILVIGSGIAGLSYALKASRHGRVTVITKKQNFESNTNYAQGGIASVMAADDSFELHLRDTLEAGVGLCDRRAVEVLVTEGPDRVRELLEWGVHFTRSREHPDQLSLGREGGHSRRRIVRADDLTGREVERALLEAIRQNPNIEILENHLALDLIVKPDPAGRKVCLGAFCLESNRRIVKVFLARVILLATGGSGRVYLHTTNPSIATGDGVAMAWRAGAKIANMEFIQFHPTALYPDDEKAFLISEAVRGEGAVLRKLSGEAFMERYHTMADLAPRDVVARAIDREMKLSGDRHVLLDLSPIPPERIRERFPNITAECLSRGLDITREPIPVVPSAHYTCGGVLTDIDARTSIRGLLAAGEVTCTGVHGANRLASNSLLEAVVFAHRAIASSLELLEADHGVAVDPEDLWYGKVNTTAHDGVFVSHSRGMIRTMMWDYVGIVRSNQRLERAARWIRLLEREIEDIFLNSPPAAELIELRDMVTVAGLIIRCARRRHESRGLHQNIDYPRRSDRKYLRNTVIERKA